MDDQVHRPGDLLPNGPYWEVHPRHEHHGLHPGEAVPRGVGVHGGEGAIVPGVHGLQHVQGLSSPDLPHDYAVRAHAQRVSHQVPDGHLSHSLNIGWPILQADDVLMVQLELSRVFDGDYALIPGDVAGQDVEGCGLPCAGTSAHQDIETALD